MPRLVGTNSINDELFSSDVSLSDKIDVTFVGNLCGAETLNKKLSSFERDLFGEVKQWSQCARIFGVDLVELAGGGKCILIVRPDRPTWECECPSCAPSVPPLHIQHQHVEPLRGLDHLSAPD